jgi:hypoxanthine phosphoribosyltransferase
VRLSTEILIPERALRDRVRALAGAIAADTPDGGTLSVIALMDGAFVFCADLTRWLPMPVQLALVPLRSVDRGGDPANLVLPAELPVRDADVLVLEDILDTGRTLSRLRARLESLGPRRVRIAVLLDKPARRVAPVRADYAGFTVPDRWVVGYGLDYNGLYRNLPYVSYVEPQAPETSG